MHSRTATRLLATLMLTCALAGTAPAQQLTASYVKLQGCPPNPDRLQSGNQHIGTWWTAKVTSGFNRASTSVWYLYLGTSWVYPPCGTPIRQVTSGFNYGTGVGRVLLININVNSLPACANVPLPPGLSSSSTCSIFIPASFSLVGKPWRAQAVVVGAVPANEGGGNARLTTAIGGIKNL
jgi:hypothetical protein